MVDVARAYPAISNHLDHDGSIPPWQNLSHRPRARPSPAAFGQMVSVKHHDRTGNLPCDGPDSCGHVASLGDMAWVMGGSAENIAIFPWSGVDIIILIAIFGNGATSLVL